MTRSFSALALSTVLLVGLSACATAPKAETLTAGISPTEIGKPLVDGQLRAETDPVCVSFYKNAKTFVAESNKPNPGGQFFKTIGISALAGIATGGIASAGIGSTVGQVVAQTTTSAAIYQGSNIALNGAKKSGVQSKISTAAEQVSCPINFT